MNCSHTPADNDCIFCKIVAGKLPCARVYEDDILLAFLDIHPVSKGHTLVIPKGHYPTLLDLPDCLGGALVQGLKKVAAAVQLETGSAGFNCIQNNYSAAGQVVFHFHWHIIPRVDADGLDAWPGTSYENSDEMHKLALSVYSRITGGSIGG